MTTVLAHQLATGPPSRPTALDAFRLARRQFIAGQRIEMRALAEQLGVSRVTLHRWVGTRDLLLGEVHWSLAKPAFDNARARTTSHGGQAVADTIELYLADVLAAPFMHAFLEREGEIALRILTTTRSSFQANIVAYVRALISSEIGDPPSAPDASSTSTSTTSPTSSPASPNRSSTPTSSPAANPTPTKPAKRSPPS